MEWRKRLADLFAVLTSELLLDGLVCFPLTWQRFQRARHVFAEFAQARASITFARRRRTPNENQIDVAKHDLNLATRSWTGIFLRLHWSDRYRQDRREVLRLGGLRHTADAR